MLDEMGINAEIEDSFTEIELMDVEINLPLSEEDLRLAELESLVL